MTTEYDEYYAWLGGPRICNNGTCSGNMATEASTPEARMWGGAPFYAAHFIKVAFWTDSPTDEWVPPCMHYHPPSEAELDAYPDLEGGPRCCNFTEWMLRDLAKALSLACRDGEETMVITNVNASALQPHGSCRESYSERLQAGDATHADAEEHFMCAVDWEEVCR